MSSWLGGTLLEEAIPVVRGRVFAKAGQRVPEGLQFSVPRFTVENGRTVDWKPTTTDSPLARFGQVLDCTLQVADVEARIGRYLITDWREWAGQIEVTATGLLQTAADDRLTAPMAPRDEGTLQSEFLRLLPPYMTAVFDPALVDRAVPKSMEWKEDRIAALYEIAEAWPARIRTNPWGQVVVLPPLPESSAPVVSLSDGEGGTVVSAPPSDTRQGAYNMVVARSSADGVDAQAIASVLSGPMAPTGDYRPVPMFFSSPLLPTEEACLAAAQTMLANAVRPSRTLQVEMAPDPRLDLDDAVEVITDRGTPTEQREWGYVIGYELPLTVGSGSGRVDVAIF